MAYFLCKNGNGGGVNVVGSITVQDKQGSVITCTKGQTVLTQTVGSSEEVVFDIPEGGEWVVSDGSKTQTMTIVSQDYSCSFKSFDLYNYGVSGVSFDTTNYTVGISSYSKSGSVTFVNSGNNKYILIQLNTTNRYTYNACGTQDKFDFTNYTTMTVEYSHNNDVIHTQSYDITKYTGEWYFRIVVWNYTTSSQTFAIQFVPGKADGASGNSITLSSLTQSSATQAKIYRITLS